MRKHFFCGLLVLTAPVFAASLQSMTQAQVTDLLKQKTMRTINLVTLNKKLINNTMTIYFDENGHVTGQLIDNVTNNDPQIDKGEWQVQANGAFCITWQKWNNHNPICMYPYELKNSILFINQTSNSFESMVLKTNIKTGNHLQSYVT